ncbi:hypothetical protein, partial [Jiella avicenniae]
LKAGLWFRRGLLLIVSPVHGHLRRLQADIPLSPLFKFAEPPLRWQTPIDRSAGGLQARHGHQQGLAKGEGENLSLMIIAGVKFHRHDRNHGSRTTRRVIGPITEFRP